MPTIPRLKIAAPQILRSPQGRTGEMLLVYATKLLCWVGEAEAFHTFIK